jgi:hypothetical protein
VTPLAAFGVHGYPFRMRIARILVHCMRIGSGNDNHPEFPASRHQVAEGFTGDFGVIRNRYLNPASALASGAIAQACSGHDLAHRLAAADKVAKAAS